jgi:aminoglycoside phosphotransferase (APT) family kinase protein
MPAECQYLERIVNEFQLSFSTSRLVTTGASHDVVILDNRLAFRFPRSRQRQRALRDEIRLLDYLRPLVNISIPDYRYVAADGSFGGYPLIEGRPLSAWRYRAVVSRQGRAFIAGQLGVFLKHLHSIPQAIVESFNVPRRSPRDTFDLLLDTCETELYRHLTTEDIRMIEQFGPAFLHAHSLPYSNCLNHRDLSHTNVLIDNTCESIAGIIDFGARALGDPALDFRQLFDFGPATVERVYESYESGDATFLYRAFQYFRWEKLRRLLFAVQSRLEGESIEGTYRAFRTAFSSTPYNVRGPHIFGGGDLPPHRKEAGIRWAVPADIDPVIPAGESFVVIDKGRGIAWGRESRPFPERDGVWAGYPANDAVAISELEKRHSQGVHFVVVPGPMRYWLEAYPGFAAHLRQRGIVRLDNERVLVYELP